MFPNLWENAALQTSPPICLGDGELQQARVTSVSDRCQKQWGTTVQFWATGLAWHQPGQSSAMHGSIVLCWPALCSCCCLRALPATEQLLRQQSQSLCSLWQTKPWSNTSAGTSQLEGSNLLQATKIILPPAVLCSCQCSPAHPSPARWGVEWNAVTSRRAQQGHSAEQAAVRVSADDADTPGFACTPHTLFCWVPQEIQGSFLSTLNSLRLGTWMPTGTIPLLLK